MFNRKIMVLVLAFFTVCSTQASDEILKTLETSKVLFAQEMLKIKKNIVAALQAKVLAAQKAGDLKTLEKFQNEIKTFEENGSPPKSIPMLSYELDRKKAVKKMDDAFIISIRKLTMSGMIEKAKQIQQELEDFQKENKSTFLAAPAKTGSTALIDVGTVFVGSFTKTTTNKSREMRLVITKANKNKFEATLDTLDSSDTDKPAIVALTLERGNNITWILIDRGRFPNSIHTNNFAGTLKDGTITLKVTNSKEMIVGKFSLEAK